MQRQDSQPRIAIACGGTGGHLFPGLAVAGELAQAGCAITLMVSPKEVDQVGVKSAAGDARVVTLPAVALNRGGMGRFLAGAWRSYRAARAHFRAEPPQAVLAMGGFTSAPPVIAGRGLGAATFLHESNVIPGRANRWLAHVVDEAFIYFPDAARRLSHQRVSVAGMPVRSQFAPHDAPAARLALGLAPDRPTLLIMGGSQGASGINELVLRSLPLLAAEMPELQFLHLTGPSGVEETRSAYSARSLKAVVRPFLTEMELALGAASVAVSRSGASSMAELAAMRVPAILIPYPAAADDHQYYNARAFELSGAARLLDQKKATPELLSRWVCELACENGPGSGVRRALARWHTPRAAGDIAQAILRALGMEPRAEDPVARQPSSWARRALQGT